MAWLELAVCDRPAAARPALEIDEMACTKPAAAADRLVEAAPTFVVTEPVEVDAVLAACPALSTVIVSWSESNVDRLTSKVVSQVWPGLGAPGIPHLEHTGVVVVAIDRHRVVRDEGGLAG